ncbi:MAG: 3-isopropylmalate dehydratase small subunit [Acidobacteria bacterium]|nr:3-isopropylmalate dehydratase small subunit [Acidobacteriota bacterium]
MPKVIAKVGDDISTDVIYPGRFMATVLPSETPKFAFADDEELNGRLRSGAIPPGSVLLAGKNFGCGSSREQAASTLRGYELVIVARGFARIFIQNAINLGLRTITCPAIEAEIGDELELEGEAVVNMTSGKRFPIEPLPAARRAIVDAGGLIPYARKKLIESRTP